MPAWRTTKGWPPGSWTCSRESRARLFETTRRPMKGWIVVDAGMCAEDEDVSRWVSRGVEHARSLPPK
jgi:hypothetical protein